MKPFLALLLCLSLSALAEDGYRKELPFLALMQEKPKEGDVYKVRQYAAQKESDNGPTVEAVLFAYSRHTGPEVKLSLTAAQWPFVRLSQAIFLRKTATGWEYLGSRIERDQRGKIVFRY